MPRFPPSRFPPGFFDLPPDAGVALPLGIIAAWTRGPQTPERARDLLRPFTLRGIIASSDTAGLTRLTGQRSLVEILALVSRPKELIHACGKAIGGIALGVWAADNTLMFYPEGVPADRVVSMLLTVLDRVARECEVGIGLCAHRGEFYELGQGLYGPDAERVEAIGEDYTEAGELVATKALRRSLVQPAAFRFALRNDLRPSFGECWGVTDGPRLAGLEASDFRYPLPFTDQFFTGLAAWHRTRRTSLVPRPDFQTLTVVVIEREREDRDIPEVAALNDLALAAAVKRMGTGLLGGGEPGGLEVKTGGAVSIYAFPDPRGAAAFAHALRDALRREGVEVKVGLDTGQVLLFDLGMGLLDVAGSPVNVASKLAHDVGTFGTILLTAACARQAGLGALETTRLQVSGITIEAVAI